MLVVCWEWAARPNWPSKKQLVVHLNLCHEDFCRFWWSTMHHDTCVKPSEQYNTSASHPCLTLAHTSTLDDLTVTNFFISFPSIYLICQTPRSISPPSRLSSTGLWTHQRLVYQWSPPGALRRHMIWQHWYWPEPQDTMVSVAGMAFWRQKGTSELVTAMTLTEQRYSSPEHQQVTGSGGQTGKRSPPCSYNFFQLKSGFFFFF